MNSVPLEHNDSRAHRRLIAALANQLIPVTKSVTLTLSSTTTVVTDERMGEDRTVLPIPTNANAASEDIYLHTKANGSFTWGHSSAATTRTFDYIITG